MAVGALVAAARIGRAVYQAARLARAAKGARTAQLAARAGGSGGAGGAKARVDSRVESYERRKGNRVLDAASNTFNRGFIAADQAILGGRGQHIKQQLDKLKNGKQTYLGEQKQSALVPERRQISTTRTAPFSSPALVNHRPVVQSRSSRPTRVL